MTTAGWAAARSGTALAAALVGAALLGGCAVRPADSVRIVTSPADVFTCRRLGRVGDAVRTDGTAKFAAVQAQPVEGDFGTRTDTMRVAALRLGATDLLLARQFGRDWSYVSGTAYRCRH